MIYVAIFLIVFASTWAYLSWADRQPRAYLVYEPRPVTVPGWATALAAGLFGALLYGGFA